MEMWTPFLWSHRASREMERTLSFIFSFVALYLGALNPEAKRSAFGSCREEMKGSNSTAILWSSFLFELCMIHGYISISPAEGHGSLMHQSGGYVSDFFLLLLQITLSTLHTANFTCGSQHSPFTSKFSVLQSVMLDAPPVQGNHLLYKETLPLQGNVHW